MKAEEKAQEIKRLSGLDRAVEVSQAYIQHYSNSISSRVYFDYHIKQLKFWQEVKQHLTNK